MCDGSPRLGVHTGVAGPTQFSFCSEAIMKEAKVNYGWAGSLDIKTIDASMMSSLSTHVVKPNRSIERCVM